MPEATLFNNFQIAHFIVKNKVMEYYQNRNANPKCCYKRRDSFSFLWASPSDGLFISIFSKK